MRGDVLDPPAAPPRIDARLRARRIEVRRSEGRRRLRRLLAAVVVTLVAAGAWGLTRSPLLDVDRIVVHGADRTGVERIVGVSGIHVHDALVDVDAGSAVDAITTLPWVAGVEVHRSWRGAVTIEVAERTPAAVLADGTGGRWLVDGDGWVLAAAPESHELPLVEGLVVPEAGERLDPPPSALLELIGSMPAMVRELTAVVEVDDRGEIWLRLHPRPGEEDADGTPRTDGGRVRFGDGRAVQDQLTAAATVLAQVDLRDLAVLDVRVPSSPTVTRVEPDHGPDAGHDGGEDADR